MMRLLLLLSAFLPLPIGLVFSSINLSASVIFSDNFNDGDISDWTFTVNACCDPKGTNTAGAMVRSQSFASPSYSMELFLNVPSIPQQSSEYTVELSVFHAFYVPTDGFYSISFFGYSHGVFPTTISIDGKDVTYPYLLVYPNDNNFAFYESFFSILSGNHTLKFRLFNYSPGGASGLVLDDIVIQTASEPNTLLPVAIASLLVLLAKFISRLAVRDSVKG